MKQFMGKAQLDKRQRPEKAVDWWYFSVDDRSKYKPHVGAKQKAKAKRRLQHPERGLD